MEIELQGKGALVVRAYKGTPFYEVKWRNAAAKQFKRRLGRAWLEPDSREVGGNAAAGSATGS